MDSGGSRRLQNGFGGLLCAVPGGFDSHTPLPSLLDGIHCDIYHRLL
jgi:hypothetical protein